MRRPLRPLLFSAALLGTVTALAADEATLRELEARCEAARAEKLAVVRAEKIAECRARADGRTDPGFCERYYADYGNGGRTGDGKQIPRLFYDLPECVAAHEARAGLVR